MMYIYFIVVYLFGGIFTLWFMDQVVSWEKTNSIGGIREYIKKNHAYPFWFFVVFVLVAWIIFLPFILFARTKS